MPKRIHVFVNGYGAAGTEDGNYGRYLLAVLSFLHGIRGASVFLYLAGGRTNSTKVSEARAMLNWFQTPNHPERHLSPDVTVELLEQGKSTHQNLRAFSDLLATRGIPLSESFHLFCEWSRQFSVQIQADRFFCEFALHPIAFDKRSMQIHRRLGQVLIRLPLELVIHRIPYIGDAYRGLTRAPK